MNYGEKIEIENVQEMIESYLMIKILNKHKLSKQEFNSFWRYKESKF